MVEGVTVDPRVCDKILPRSNEIFYKCLPYCSQVRVKWIIIAMPFRFKYYVDHKRERKQEEGTYPLTIRCDQVHVTNRKPKLHLLSLQMSMVTVSMEEHINMNIYIWEFDFICSHVYYIQHVLDWIKCHKVIKHISFLITNHGLGKIKTCLREFN